MVRTIPPLEKRKNESQSTCMYACVWVLQSSAISMVQARCGSVRVRVRTYMLVRMQRGGVRAKRRA